MIGFFEGAEKRKKYSIKARFADNDKKMVDQSPNGGFV